MWVLEAVAPNLNNYIGGWGLRREDWKDVGSKVRYVENQVCCRAGDAILGYLWYRMLAIGSKWLDMRCSKYEYLFCMTRNNCSISIVISTNL